MNRREAMEYNYRMNALASLGFNATECAQLRRISMTLRRWHERECGDGNGCIERDETTGKWRSVHSGKAWAITDMETGAKKRLAAIMAKHPTLATYIQTDPRGAALYILRPGDVPTGEQADAYYTRGICVY